MSEVDWIPGIIVAFVGIVGGVILALRAGAKASSAKGTRDERRADLLAQKTALYEQLRDLDDMGDRRGPEADGQRAVLERRAAEVLKALAGVEATPTEAATAPPTTTPPVEAPVATPNRGFLSAELRGGLVGATVVALLGAVLWGLQDNAGVRPENGIATGGDFLPWGTTQGVAPEAGAIPAPGTVGGAAPGVPPDLQPKPSPMVDAARVAVGANPSSVEAHVQLGWALIDAEGWIDAYREGEQVLKLDPTSPDGRVISAAVRIVMGMETIARELLDEALAYDPKHIQGLSYSGMLHMRAGNRGAAAIDWQKAKDAGGDAAAFDKLIALSKSDAPFPAAGGAGPQGRPAPNAGGDPHAGHDHGDGAVDPPVREDITGTLTLGAGAKPPAGGRIFVIARRPGVAGGPPAATAALPPKLPATFRLGAENVMMGGPFPDKVELTVRWDADGDAMTKGEQDLWGAADQTIDKGTSGVEIILQ